MASKKKSDFSGTIVTADNSGNIVRTEAPETKKANTSTKPSTTIKGNVSTQPVRNDNVALFSKANQAIDNKRVNNLNQQQKLFGLLKDGSSNFLEGYANSMWDTGLNIGQGFNRTLEGLADFLQYKSSDSQKAGAAALESILGKNALSDFYRGSSDWLKKNAQFDSTGSLFGTNENAQDTLLGNQWRQDINEKSYLGDLGDSIGEGIGNIGAMAALSAVGSAGLGAAGIGTTATGGLTTAGKLISSGVPSFTSAYGNSRSEAYNNGANDKDARIYGFVNGLAEAASEQFFDAMPGIKSVGFADKLGIKDFLANKLKSKLGTGAGKVFLKVIGGLEEGGEEMISNALVAMGSDLVHMLDSSYTYGMENNTGNPLEDGWNALFSEDSLKSFFSAGITSILLGAGNQVLTAAQQNQIISDYAKENNITTKEARDELFSDENIAKAQEIIQKQADNDLIEINNDIEREDATKKLILDNKQAFTQQAPTQTQMPQIETKPQKNTNTQPEEIKQENEPTNKLQEGLEKQGEKIFLQAENDFQSAKQNILDYLEENDIKNPTKQDMMNAFGWYDEYDASQDMQELKRAERIYSEAADELLSERENIPETKVETKEEIKNDNIAERKSDEALKVSKEQQAQEITNDLNDTIQGKETKTNNKQKEDFETIKRDIEKQTGKKMRGFIETATEAEKTTDLIKAMDKDKITYEQQSNKKTVQMAKNDIKDLSYDEKVQKARDIFDSDKRIKATDIAMLHMIAQEARDNGDYDIYNEITEYRAILETESGQVSQAAAIIQNSDPKAQLDTLKKIIKREQRKGNKIYKGVTVDENLVKEVMSTFKEDGTYDKKQFNKAMDKLKQSIANQMHVTIGEKLSAWRYLSMLGNPKTHIRNVVANVAMTMLQGTKNRVAAGIETLTPDVILNAENRLLNRIYGDKRVDATRGKTIKFASKEVKQYARQAINDYFSENKQGSKYIEDAKTLKKDLEQRRKIWSNRHPLGIAANTFNKVNNALLNWEDNFFSKGVARRSLQNFLAANGIETQEDIEANPDLMEQALDYAIFKGEEATFHQYSKTGEVIRNAREALKRDDNKIAKKLGKGGSILTKGTGVMADAVMPFVNTPINIAKTGVEYTPLIGLAKTLLSDVRNAPANLKADVLIDGISKQFAGGMLAAVGYALASAGAIKGKGEGDKEDKLEKDLGQQDYSIMLSDEDGNTNTYDLSWLSPSAMPLFVGVELYNATQGELKLDESTVIDALANTLDPLSEMSVISSLADTLKTYTSDSNARAIIYNIASSYISQYIPTLLGQIASANDDKQRQYKNSGESLPETIYNQARYKIPGARNTLPEKVDVWGNTKKNVSAFESFFSPANRREYRVDSTTKELEELEKLTKDTKTSALPTIVGSSRSVTVDGHDYSITGEALTEYKKTWGKTAKQDIDNLLNSEAYKNADLATKEKMVSAMYDYATYKAKKEYTENNDIDYTDDNKYALVDAFNIPYYKYESMQLGKEGVTKKDQKMEAIDNSGLTQEQKDVINLIQSYKYYEADVPRLISVINNSNLSKSQKEKLIKKIKENSTKGGKDK